MCRCLPIPSTDVFCRATFRYTHFSPHLNVHVKRISELFTNASLMQDCTDFIAFYQCLGSYTPCNPTTLKIYDFCEDACDIINKYAQKCFDFIYADPALLMYFAQFNCSNPLTFTSSLTLNYYEPPTDEICDPICMYHGKLL